MQAYFDSVLPEGYTLSSINEKIGLQNIEAEYGNVTRHDKWSIPWLEDDRSASPHSSPFPRVFLRRPLTFTHRCFTFEGQCDERCAAVGESDGEIHTQSLPLLVDISMEYDRLLVTAACLREGRRSTRRIGAARDPLAHAWSVRKQSSSCL